MQRLLSTYLFVSRKLTRDLLGQIADAGFTGVEIFCSRAHFDYTSKTEARDIGALRVGGADEHLALARLDGHAVDLDVDEFVSHVSKPP